MLSVAGGFVDGTLGWTIAICGPCLAALCQLAHGGREVDEPVFFVDEPVFFCAEFMAGTASLSDYIEKGLLGSLLYLLKGGRLPTSGPPWCCDHRSY